MKEILKSKIMIGFLLFIMFIGTVDLNETQNKMDSTSSSIVTINS